MNAFSSPWTFWGSKLSTPFLVLPHRTLQPRNLSIGLQALLWPREQKSSSGIFWLICAVPKALLPLTRPHASTNSKFIEVVDSGSWEGMQICDQVAIFLELDSETHYTSANATSLECLSPQTNYLEVELELNATTSSLLPMLSRETSFSQWLLFLTWLLSMHRQPGWSLFNVLASCLHHTEAADLRNYEHWRESISINAVCFTNTASDEAAFDIALVITILLLHSLLFV